MNREGLNFAKMPRKDFLSLKSFESESIRYYQGAFLPFACRVVTAVFLEEHIIITVNSTQRVLIQEIVDSSGYEGLEWMEPT